MTALMLALADKKSSVDVSAHAELVTHMLLGTIALVILFFVFRPELWRRLFLDRVDPRPAALMRIFFGGVVLWTFLDLTVNAEFLFTDQGLWLNDMARKNYGGKLKTLWDPEHGFEHWWGLFAAMWAKFSILHFRSDPAYVYSIYTLMLVSLVLMILGVWTRFTTLLAWFLVEQVYRYTPIFYTGGDTVTRVFMFLGVFAAWGEAYSVDGWWKRRKAILGGATTIPAARKIPAWPMRLMMLQLTMIYCATGLLKSGGTWRIGTALYYALNLDHFYRVPATNVVTFLQYTHVLKVLTVVVHWWEVLFPLALIGLALNAYERERKAGIWVSAARWRRVISWFCMIGVWTVASYVSGVGAYYYVPLRYLPFPATKEQVQIGITAIVAVAPLILIPLYLVLRRYLPRVFQFVLHWVLGKRFWLVVGFGMHIGIDVGMNVGTFAEVMMAVYFAWLSGAEVEAFWRYALSRPLTPGEGSRPTRNKRWKRILLGPFDRLLHRGPGRPYVVHHAEADASVRRVALMRLWDLGERLQFEADATVSSGFQLEVPGSKGRLGGAQAGAALTVIFPGLWWLRPFRHIPGLRLVAGGLAFRILKQRA